MGGPGAPPLLNIDELKESITQLSNKNGKVMKPTDIMKEILVDRKRRKMDAAGYIAGGNITIPSQTASNYMALCAGNADMHLVETTIDKTAARDASEGSFRNVFLTVLIILVTHFIEIPEEDPAIRKIVNQMSPNERKMYDLASQCRGGRAVYPLPRRNMINNDDKVFYAKPGSNKGGTPTAMICSTSSLKKRKSESLCDTNASPSQVSPRERCRMMIYLCLRLKACASDPREVMRWAMLSFYENLKAQTSSVSTLLPRTFIYLLF